MGYLDGNESGSVSYYVVMGLMFALGLALAVVLCAALYGLYSVLAGAGL